MEEEKERCRHQYHYYKKKQCTHAVYNNGLCIFHCPKLSEKERSEIPVEHGYFKYNLSFEHDFRDEFIRLLKKQSEDTSAKELDFSEFRFPHFSIKGAFNEIIETDSFQKPVDFCGAEFQEVDFTGVKFKEANFSGAKFYLARFRGAQFNKVNFSGAEFNEGDFLFVKLESSDFSYAQIAEGIYFDGESVKGSFHGKVDFRWLSFKDEGKLILERVDLSRACFNGTPLLEEDKHRVEFNDVTWGRNYFLKGKIPSFFRRKILIEELEEKKPNEFLSGYQGVYDLYHQLVKIYESKREFETAEDFHVGEMEMRRKYIWATASPRWHGLWRWIRLRANSYWVYKWLSNYGTNYWWAFFMLLCMLGAFSGIFLLSGFTVVDERTVNYNFGWGAPSWADIKEAMRYTLSILPFQRSMRYEPYGILTEIWKVAAVLVFSSQFALLLLAVRRRFKR